jgi:hypothetical protein
MQSDQINELAAALSKAQGEMQAAIKDKINPFFKSSYADLGSVWDAARPVLSKYGLCVMQTTELLADKIVMVTTLAHTSGQWVKSLLPLNPAKNDSQGVGAAITYLRRYSLSAIVGVVCDDDDDGETASGRGKYNEKNKCDADCKEKLEAKKESSEKIDKTQVLAIHNLLSNLDKDTNKKFMEWINLNFKAQTVQDIPKDGYEKCLVKINANIKYLKDQERVVA